MIENDSMWIFPSMMFNYGYLKTIFFSVGALDVGFTPFELSVSPIKYIEDLSRFQKNFFSRRRRRSTFFVDHHKCHQYFLPENGKNERFYSIS